MRIIYLLLAALLMASCQGEYKTEKKTRDTKDSDLLAANAAALSPFDTDNLPLQSFTVDAGKASVVTGKNGTSLRIPKNAFVDKNGKPVKGKVTVALKEALSMTDIVMAGLATTSNGQTLETGGMIYVGAAANDEELAIAPDKEIMVTVPTGKKLDNMELFTGQANEAGVINWVDPKDVIATELNLPSDDDNWSKVDEILSDNGTRESGTEPPLKPAKYTDKGNDLISVNFENPDMFPEFSNYKNVQWQLVDQKSYTDGDAQKDWYSIKVDREAKKGEYTLTFTGRDAKGKVVKTYGVVPVFEGKDYDVAMAEYEEKFTAYQKDVKEQQRIAREERIKQEKLRKVQQNAYNEITDAEKYGTAYVFPLRQLGWVNCDRFYSDPKAQEAIVQAKVNNEDEEGKTFAYLVFTKLNICLAGYKNGDGAFVFDNGSGPMKMPIGEKALVIAVCDNEDKQRFAMAETTIARKVSLDLKLVETTPEKMREMLDRNLKPKL